MAAVENLREKAYRDRSNKCKERQKKKFDLLLLSRIGHEGKMNKMYEDKWVANHSSRVLSEKEKEVLSKGLNFAPIPLRIPVPEIIIAVEEGLSKINSNDAKLSRNSIIGILNKAIVPRPNITPEEIKAMKNLQKEDSIIITCRQG